MAKQGTGFITGRVTDRGDHPIHRAEVTFTRPAAAEGNYGEQQPKNPNPAYTDAEGYFRSEELDTDTYSVHADAFQIRSDPPPRTVTVEAGCTCDVALVIAKLNFSIEPAEGQAT